MAKIGKVKFPANILKNATGDKKDFATILEVKFWNNLQIKWLYVNPHEKSLQMIPHMTNFDLTQAELEWIWLTLNRFQRQFLFQDINTKWQFSCKNWHGAMGICSPGMSFDFINNIIIVLVYNSQISVTISRRRKICWQMSPSSNVARYCKKE